MATPRLKKADIKFSADAETMMQSFADLYLGILKKFALNQAYNQRRDIVTREDVLRAFDEVAYFLEGVANPEKRSN